MAFRGEVGVRARRVESAVEVTPPAGEFAAVILAGGASSRMGSPKPLLDYRGETFVDRLIRVFRVRCRPVVVVLGYGAEAVARGMKRAGESVLVLNAQPERGQLSSLQAGLRALGAAPRGVFFHPVDIPAIAETTVDRMIAEWGEAPVAQPRYQGRKGHPVLIAPEVAAELLGQAAEATAREVLDRHRERTCWVEVDDAGILRDADTPDDYRRLSAGAEER